MKVEDMFVIGFDNCPEEDSPLYAIDYSSGGYPYATWNIYQARMYHTIEAAKKDIEDGLFNKRNKLEDQKYGPHIYKITFEKVD